MSRPLAVELRDVRVAFGGQAALDSVTLDVPPGQRVALVGPSGAGKTTLLRLCTGGLTADAGTVRVLGTNLATASDREVQAVRRRIGSVHQQLDLVGPLRVVHNVNAGRLGQWRTCRALRSLVRPVEVGTARQALDRMGIAAKLLERTDRLSGGEQQRVALARVLVADPDLILADEPVSSLDPARADDVMDLLAGVAGAKTLVVSLHDFDLARRRCDRIVGLRDGRVVFDLDAGAATDDVRTSLYRIQTG